MSHFSNLAKIEGVRTYRPYPAFRLVKWRADQILKGRDSTAVECAASYVIQSIDEFRTEELATQIEAHVRHLAEEGGWELNWLPRTDHHPDDPDQGFATEGQIRDLLNNWPSHADDRPTYDQISDIDALGEIFCSAHIYQFDSIQGCRNASEAELYAVLALIKLDEAAWALYMPEKRTEEGITIHQSDTAMGITKAVDAANCLIEAMEIICSAQQQVYSALRYKHKEEADLKLETAWKIEIAKNERNAFAIAGANARSKKYDEMKTAALSWYRTERSKFQNKDDAAIEITKIHPVEFSTARGWQKGA